MNERGYMYIRVVPKLYSSDVPTLNEILVDFYVSQNIRP